VRKLLMLVLMAVAVLMPGCVSLPRSSRVENTATLVFGDVTVCKTNFEIRFSATVQQVEGWVQHLLYLHGYQWLKEQSAIVSDARLSQLQHAIALLNEALWDKLWIGLDSDEAFEVRVYIEYAGRRVKANELVQSDEELHVGDMVFLGCPYFDVVALGSASLADCRLCPVLPLEQKALQERFVRQNGESGYEINTPNMFAVGAKVQVIMKIPNSPAYRK